MLNNQSRDALAILQTIQNENAYLPAFQLTICLGYSFQNQKDKFLKLYSENLKGIAWDHSFYSWLIAGCFALLNEKEDSLDWIENAVNRGS